jgi:hypothetical protein
MHQQIGQGTEWRSDSHRLDVVVIKREEGVVEFKPILRNGGRAKRCFVPVEDFLRYYRPKPVRIAS